MDLEEKKYLIALKQFIKFGTASLKKLNNHFSSYKEAFNANINMLTDAGITEKVAFEFINERTKINPDKLLDQLYVNKIETICIQEKNYPKLLKEIFDPPPLLYYKGKMISDEYCIGIVGSRKFTSYGQLVTENIVNELAGDNLTIVSGLALGIDTIAHQKTIQHSNRTIAVLGTGIDDKSIYPRSNINLAKNIINTGGLILSEFPIGAPPLRHHFPLRNRIISGLSLGILVVEAEKKSGALITAFSALEQNREVFAIPGNIYSPSSIGSNNLIKNGAKMVLNANDILDDLNLKNIKTFITNKKIIPESKEEEIILKFITHEPIHIDDIARETKINSAILSSILIMMEMKGMIKNVGGMEYILSR